MPKPNVAATKKALAEYTGTDALGEHIRLLLAMPEEEALPVLQATAELRRAFRNMGPITAFEVVVALGHKMAELEARAAS